MKASRTCYPKTCHFDINIILSERQLTKTDKGKTICSLLPFSIRKGRTVNNQTQHGGGGVIYVTNFTNQLLPSISYPYIYLSTTCSPKKLKSFSSVLLLLKNVLFFVEMLHKSKVLNAPFSYSLLGVTMCRMYALIKICQIFSYQSVFGQFN